MSGIPTGGERGRLRELGRGLVERRLLDIGCGVQRDADQRSSRLLVRGPDAEYELYLSTQRVGGYAFWSKRRLQPSAHRFAVIVVLEDAADPDVFVIPTLDWLAPEPPLTDRDYEGQASEPEYGVSLTPADLQRLRSRYSWTERFEKTILG